MHVDTGAPVARVRAAIDGDSTMKPPAVAQLSGLENQPRVVVSRARDRLFKRTEENLNLRPGSSRLGEDTMPMRGPSLMSTIMCTRSAIQRESRSCTPASHSAMCGGSTAYELGALSANCGLTSGNAMLCPCEVRAKPKFYDADHRCSGTCASPGTLPRKPRLAPPSGACPAGATSIHE
jgi:hypothetical protein